MEATREEAAQVREALLTVPLHPPIVSCEVRPYLPGLASTLFVAELRETQSDKTLPAIVKIPPQVKEMGEVRGSDKQFANEAWMFNEVIPKFLSRYESDSSTSLFTKCYYASCDSKSPMIVVENLEVSGYRICADKAMDYDHCLVALKALARFHSYSYAMKRTDGQDFHRQIRERCQETKFIPNSRYFNIITILTRRTGLNSINDFIRIYPELVEKYKQQLQTLRDMLDEFFRTFSDLIKPDEPFTVLCHGDFNRNNMLFRYGEDGKPVHVKLIDFQTIRYASPAIDISLFFYLNTTPELRAQFEQDLLWRYHEAVLESLAEMLRCTVDALRSELPFQQFKSSYARHAVYGYLIAVEFIHIVYATEEQVAYNVNILKKNQPTEEDLVRFGSLGGVEVKEITAEMVKQLLENGYVK